ncbi:MAG: translocation/assembly module TamB domain-containing protein [Phascolarctobacterium sp.]|nr:translocation/assembly module TamB domain-containing protein [Phascolarctobacterium sp.]
MKRYFRFLAFLIVLLSAGYIFLVHSVMPKYIRQMLPQVNAIASEMINGTITVGDMTWEGGLNVELADITVTDAQGAKVAELPRTIIKLRPWRALQRGERAVGGVEIMRPQVYLTMDNKQKWNLASLLKPSDSDETPFYGLLGITEGKLHVSMPQGKWEIPVAGTVNGESNPNFALDLRLGSGVDTLKLKGLLNTKGEGRMELVTNKLDLTPYAPLAKSYANIEELKGGFGKLALLYVNENKKQRFSGDVDIVALEGKLAANGAQHSVRLDGAVRAQDNMLTIAGLDAVIDQQSLHLEGEADLRDTDNPSGKGVLSSEQLAYGEYKAEKLRIPFRADKREVVLENIAAQYGGGTISGNGTYNLEEKVLMADVNLQNVTHQPVDSPKDAVHINAKLAVLAAQQDEKLDIHAAAETMDLSWRNLTIKQMNFDGGYDKQGLVINHFSAAAGDKGVLLAKGSVNPEGELMLEGRMTDFPINPILDAAGQAGTGLCSTGFKVGGRVTAPEFAGIIQLSQAEFLQQKIKEAHGFIAVKDNLVTIKNFRAHMEQGQHIISGLIDIRGAEPVVDLSLETDNVRIEPIMRLLLNQEEVPVTGNLTNIMQITGPVSKPTVYGEVHATDGSAMQQLYNSVDGRYTYDKGSVRLDDFLINAFYANVKLNGTMTTEGALNFDLVAKDVDLAHLPIKDDTVELGGKVNAKGHLGGKLTMPTFRGDVDSARILINGEPLTELEGSIDGRGLEKNEFKVSFKQPYKNDPLNYGIYTADVNLNLKEKFMQGKVQMLWGDIGGLLRMARMDYDINGQMQGLLDFCPQGKGSGLNIAISADDVKIHDLNYAHMALKGNIKETLLTVDEIKLQEQDEVMDKGLITANGKVELKEHWLQLEMQALKANPAIATAPMKEPPEIKGEMDMQIKLAGSFDNPSGTGTLEITNGSVAGVGVDKLTAALALKNDSILLEQLVGTKDAYSVKASGDIPLDIFRSKEQRRNPRAQMNIIMDLNEARLGILPAMTKMVEWGVGDTNGSVRLAGTLEEPLLYGSLKIAEGAVKVKDLDTVLENIALDVDFAGNEILLRNLSMKLGKGMLSAEGSYALQTKEDAAYKLHVKADKAELASQIFTGRINSEVEIIPQKYRDFRKRKGNTPPPQEYRPLIKGFVKLDDVVVNMPTIPEMGEGESNFGLDMKVELGKKIHLYNSYLYDIWLKGGIHITGSTLYPNIDGTIKADKGTITYLRTDFKLKDAGLVWVEPGTFLPNVNLESTARFSRYRIYMHVSGPVEKMDLQLTSDPQMERNTIVRMLTLQRDTAGSNEVTSEDMNNLMTAGLQMTVLGDVETWIKQTLGLDQFRIYTGKVRSGIGYESTKDRTADLTADERNQYNILVSKYLNNNFMFGYTTSFDALDRSFFGQYDIGRHMNITYSKSYDLNDKTDSWYGLEYKITF